ncbi:single-stranded DNA-binding protein [Campylobacter sp. 19-13652]|uniref:single-stranded DNA-binding protein n=1 Tax=Campylobacter sp. 19-13652 TaxID=2840180 RepID=UPI001C746B84|nr:single-stranded DNA-binding protein [Campylobacter sp. 19-13652]BCX79500.1 single-stranded DNA-binding protein [Campylobacter sp. 19-13652]
MFNKVVLVGNLTRDIELRYTTTGSAIGNSAIAVTRKFTTNGERREETCFIDITFFGKQAEIANQYLNKGSKLLVEGRLKFEQWTDSNGQNRSKHTVTVENMEMLGGNQNTQGGGYNNPNNQGYNGGYNNQNSYTSPDNYNNQSSNYGNYNQSQSYQNQGNYQQQQRAPQRHSEPEIDIDKYDNDETIPF